ncbi:MAG: hypothetical protein WCJ62_00920 [Flavobacterium sp.]
MKKIILLISFTSLLFSCSNGGNASSSNNNNGNSWNSSMDYEFTITFNGQVHKIKGNTTNGIPEGSSSQMWTTNQCEAISAAGTHLVVLKINDVTAPNYISGQNLECRIYLPNLLMGVNQAQIMFLGSYFDSLYTSAGYTGTGGNYTFQTTSGTYNSSIANKLPINITDLGTNTTQQSTFPLNVIGQTLKGNYSGTIYMMRGLSSGAQVCDIPVTLSIDFKAVRTY